MVTLSSLNLVIEEPKQLLLVNGNPAGRPLEPGNYVAKPNIDQESGAYSLYEADAHFHVRGGSVANVYLSITPGGQVFLLA